SVSGVSRSNPLSSMYCGVSACVSTMMAESWIAFQPTAFLGAGFVGVDDWATAKPVSNKSTTENRMPPIKPRLQNKNGTTEAVPPAIRNQLPDIHRFCRLLAFRRVDV